MTLRPRAFWTLKIRLTGTFAVALVAVPLALQAQTNTPPRQVDPPMQRKAPAQSQKAATGSTAATNEPDRSSAYYHYGLAHLYEQMAVDAGRPDYATQAIEEYKLALNADPNSTMLQNGLAELYFRLGRIQDAVNAAKDQIKRNPNDVEAHTLLGQVYVRSLGDMQGPQSQQTLAQAIAEYETIARLKPNDIEAKLLLGELYAANHESPKAEAEFKEAQKIDSNSEEVVLSMAKLYSDEGDLQRAAAVLAGVPQDDRSAREEYALGQSYDRLKKAKEAAAAYKRSLDLEPDNPEVEMAFANALLEDNQLDESLKVFQKLQSANPTDLRSTIQISEIQRRQGHYEESLATLEKLKGQIQPGTNEELQWGVDEALDYDAMGKYDQATALLTKLVNATTHPDGKYSDQEKSNRAYFLNRLGIIYREQNKTAEAVAAFKQIADLGGDCATSAGDEDDTNICYAESGYESEVDAYREAHMWKEATAAAAEAAKALPKSHDAQLLYARQIADTGQVEQGLALAKAQLTNTPDDLEVHENLAEMYIRLKRFDEATAEINKAEALTKKPTDKWYIAFLRGDEFDRQKMYDQAEVQFRKALELDPKNAMVLNYLGYMLADNGTKLQDAMKLIQQAIVLDPQNGAYLDSLGWVYFKLGQYPEAESNLRKANERMNNDPTVHDHLGEVYEKTGNLKMAVAQWERSMTEYAHSLPADADPEDVAKVQHKLESARVKLAKLTPASESAKGAGK
ncbi:MAG TPA: tetratricopeptide repeat protein [Acidobacteriaceae bacterium]|nr:tetratricopeptide repeat protein [Acidobacteriaceae bacterium]